MTDRSVPAESGQSLAAGPDKSARRAGLRARRAARGVEQATADAVRLADHLDALLAGLRPAPGAVAAYLARPGEPSTAEALRRWRAQGRPVLLPLVRADLDLDWAPDTGRYRRGAVVPVDEPDAAPLGRTAIASADVVVVPALAVDRLGTRLGQGGGSYDRALARVAPHAVVVALLHPGELLDEPLPVEPHDRPVHAVITVEGVSWLSPAG